ncbi:MAG TPA: archease [Thermoanaerobaculia bacterium]|nr:archease [Thermoanaerobaculia bacterium]
MTATHAFVDHTSEIGLQLRAGSFPELLAEAGRGLARLMLREVPAEAEGEAREIEVSAHDRESLLVDWLNEILYVAETGLWIPLELELLEATDTRLRVRARGVTVEVSPSLVKAATFHGLEVVETADGVSAEVILDV